VTVALSGGSTSKPSTTTDSSGNYSFTGLAGGTYTVTPTLAGYTFSPSAPSVTITANNTPQNFVETPVLASFSISGSVSYSGAQTGKPFNTIISVFNGGCSNCGGSVAGTSITSVPSSTGIAYTV
jgi:hypothetical protein